MAEEQHSFDEVVDTFHGKIEQAEQVVTDAPPDRRASLEQELNEIYRSISHLSPIGVRSHTLLETPSDSGIYSAENIVDQVQEKLQGDVMVDRLQAALKDTGISTQEVVSRIEIGSQNAALEQQWLSRDLAAIAETEGLDLYRREDLEKAVDRLDELHGELGRVLNDADVLRDAGNVEVTENDRAPIDGLPPTASEALQRLRQDPTSDPFRDDLDRDALRQELHELIGDELSAGLAIGDGRNPFTGRSMSERTEETALLPEDEARRMDLDDIILVVDAQMPVRAKRVKYYEDRFFKEIFGKQSGELPYPSASDQMRGL